MQILEKPKTKKREPEVEIELILRECHNHCIHSEDDITTDLCKQCIVNSLISNGYYCTINTTKTKTISHKTATDTKPTKEETHRTKMRNWIISQIDDTDQVQLLSIINRNDTNTPAEVQELCRTVFEEMYREGLLAFDSSMNRYFFVVKQNATDTDTEINTLNLEEDEIEAESTLNNSHSKTQHTEDEHTEEQRNNHAFLSEKYNNWILTQIKSENTEELQRAIKGGLFAKEPHEIYFKPAFEFLIENKIIKFDEKRQKYIIIDEIRTEIDKLKEWIISEIRGDQYELRRALIKQKFDTKDEYYSFLDALEELKQQEVVFLDADNNYQLIEKISDRQKEEKMIPTPEEHDTHRVTYSTSKGKEQKEFKTLQDAILFTKENQLSNFYITSL